MTGLVRAAAGTVGLTLGAIALVLAGVAGLAVAAALVPTLARAWLPVFMAAGAAPVGATVLLMIGDLTGGRWHESWRPVLGPLAAGTVAVALAFLPVAAALPAVYPWAADPATAPPGVARLYLNAPFFLGRAAVALLGWSILGLLFGLGRPSRLVAGLGLAFHGLAISLVAIDWFLSLEPGFTSSSFGATVAIAQIATALGVVALVGREDGTRADLGGLLLATQIGLAYLDLMAFIVAWYGDLPETIGWYAGRGRDGWLALLLGALLLGAVVPVAILLRQRWRAGGPALRLAGGSALAGLALHDLWILGPPLGPLATVWGGLALLLVFGALAARPMARTREAADVR